MSSSSSLSAEVLSSSSTEIMSSSSTEIMSSSESSSSSSSYLDYHGDRTIPFIFETEAITPIWSMASYGEYIYAGTGPEGLLLRSSDRYFWEKIYSVDDINIKSLCVQNDTLFIGTSPNGMIYIMDLKTGQITLSQELGNEIFGFIHYKNKMYASGGIPNQIWVYNTVKNRWDAFYRPHASVITKMLVFQDKLYLFSNSENIISFDGDNWVLETYGIDNIASARGVSEEPFSHLSNNVLSRSNVKSVTAGDVFDNEDVYDIYPLHYSMGLKSADVDGSSLVVGSASYAKVYNFFGNEFHPTFQTESGNTVNYLLNVDIGSNLASIDNKLYLIYCGDLPTSVTSTTTSGTTTTTTTPPLVSMIYPQGGENLVVGTTITIQWKSIGSINDAVKIELYKGNSLSLTINPNTSNDGQYEWNIPANLIPGSDYFIKITWLTTQSGSSSNTAQTLPFSIWYAAVATTTTTTTTPIDATLPTVNNCRGIPLLELANDEYITYMLKDAAKGGILFSTSKGRILGCSDATVNAYLTGDRNVYAEVTDGFGNISQTMWTTFFYALYNKIVQINEQKEVVKWKFEEKPTAIVSDRITGVFLSPVLSVKEDLNFWKELIWQEDKPAGTEIIICVRSADTAEEMKLLPWDYCFTSRDSDRAYGSTGFITRALKEYHIHGKYLQFKVTMTTDIKDTTPSVLNLAITYSTKFATYFFTTKFALQNQSGVKSGLVIANMTQPINTEIKFGMIGTNTADWNEYTVVPLDKFFSLNDFERLKVGIKMITYDENIPEVAEFSLLTGSEKDNLINQ